MLIPAITFGPTRVNDVDDARVLEFLGKISVLGPVFVSIEDLENAAEQDGNRLLMKRVIDKTNTNSLTPCYLEGLKIDQDELATELLDAGLHGIFFRQPAPAETLELDLLSKVLASFPRARVGVSVHISEALAAGPAQAVAEYIERVVAANRANAIHYYVQVHTSSQQVLEAVRDVAKALVQRSTSSLDNVQMYLGIPPALNASTKMAAKISTSTTDNTIHAVFRPRPFPDPAAASSSSSSSSSSNSGSAGEAGGGPEDGVDTLSAFISCIRSDRPDGLFTTVVCDEHGVSLGLVYSNDVSIRAAVHEKKGIYWSRSRGGLWRKGDSSGMYQELLAVALDCDGDALRFTVVQHGTPPAFCHLMTRTCWGDVHGLQHLQSILRARLVSAPEGSYTKRLFTDHNLLKKKLVEEAQELAEATTHDDVAGEAADLMYFLMTRCVAAGVSLRDIERKLDDRSLKVTRRPGNAKAWRDENAAKILAGGVTTGQPEEGNQQPPPAPQP